MVRDTFASLRDSLAADDPAAVDTDLQRLDAELPAQRAREEGYVKQARAARGSREVGDAATSSALALQQQVGEVVSARGRIFTAVDHYLTGNQSGQEAADAVDAELDTFDELQQSAESFDAAVDTESLPPVLVVTGLETLAVPKGTAVEETITVRNVGGSELTDVSLTVETNPSVDLSLSRTEFDALPAGESATATLAGTPLKDTDVTITATGGDLADSIDTNLNVRDAREIIGEGLNDVYELLKRLRASLSEATDDGGEGGTGGSDGNGRKGNDEGNGGENGNGSKGGPDRGFEAKLEAVTKSLAKAFDRIEDGDPESAVDDKLDAAINQTEAFVNHVRAQSGKRLAARDAAELVTDARSLVAIIEEAKVAEP